MVEELTRGREQWIEENQQLKVSSPVQLLLLDSLLKCWALGLCAAPLYRLVSSFFFYSGTPLLRCFISHITVSVTSAFASNVHGHYTL